MCVHGEVTKCMVRSMSVENDLRSIKKENRTKEEEEGDGGSFKY